MDPSQTILSNRPPEPAAAPFVSDAQTAAGTPVSERGGAMTLVAVAAGFVMAMLDVTIVNVALKPMQISLSMSFTALVWVVDAYTLSFAALLLLGGAFANRIGAKAVYQSGLATFVVASLLCGFAITPAMLLCARLLQGVGAALFMPSSLSLLTEAFPAGARRRKMIGIWGALVSTAMALGPLCGGVLIARFGWRCIFWVNLPIGIVGLWLTGRYVAPSPRLLAPLNLPGHCCGAIALASLSYALIEAPASGWEAPAIFGSAMAAVVAALAFVLLERNGQHRIFPHALIESPAFMGGTTIGLLINFAVIGALFLLSLYLQHQRGLLPLEVGLQLSPLMLLFAIGNLLSARVSHMFGARHGLLGGVVLAALASLALVLIGAMPYWMIVCCVGLANLGAGEAIPAMNLAVMQSAGSSHSNTAAATLNASRQIGSLLGVAAVSIVLQAAGSLVMGYAVSFGVIAAAFFGAAAVAVSAFRD
ncbi:MFS transporter [Paraburkholderia sp. XV]|uniref:MFS transporter n=1 Tax=Paraburkholderia sp. XV TaxID=2831520 RepID=UPI001CD76218|nr:MFS transporter [Paraburkholderia sp. XV]